MLPLISFIIVSSSSICVSISYHVVFICHCVFTFPCSVTDVLKNVLLLLPSSLNEILWLWDHLILTSYCIEYSSLQSFIILRCHICKIRNGLTLAICMLDFNSVILYSFILINYLNEFASFVIYSLSLTIYLRFQACMII